MSWISYHALSLLVDVLQAQNLEVPSTGLRSQEVAETECTPHIKRKKALALNVKDDDKRWPELLEDVL